jgi:hypothetical protein
MKLRKPRNFEIHVISQTQVSEENPWHQLAYLKADELDNAKKLKARFNKWIDKVIAWQKENPNA